MYLSRRRVRRPLRRPTAMGDEITDLLAAGFDKFLQQTKDIAANADTGPTDITSDSPLISSGVSFVNKGGVCKPADKNTLLMVTGFQKQLNRVAQAKGLSKIGVDGDIGPGTQGLYASVVQASGGAVPSGSLCGNDLPGIAVSVQSFADSLGAPVVASSPPAKTPSFVNPTTGIETKVPAAGASIGDMFKGMSTPLKLTFVGILGGIGYFVFLEKRGGARAKGRR